MRIFNVCLLDRIGLPKSEVEAVGAAMLNFHSSHPEAQSRPLDRQVTASFPAPSVGSRPMERRRWIGEVAS